MRTLILGGLQEARKASDKRVVVMGYCFGGAATLELARSGQAQGIAGYASSMRPRNTRGPGLSVRYAAYPDCSWRRRQLRKHGRCADLARELESTGAPYEIQVYSGAPHGFTEFNSDRYQKRADEQSWTAFLNFLATNLGD